MQSIAKEMGLSETAYVSASRSADFSARYFTPLQELPFAGHPTIAVVHTLLHAGLISQERRGKTLSLELPAGVISIDVQEHSNRRLIVMSQLAPQFLRTYDPDIVLPIFGLSTGDLLPGAVIQTVSTGTPILMIPLASHDALKRVRYADEAGYSHLKKEGDFYFSHHFTLQGATRSGGTFSRSLGAFPNGLEDPFTGSATGCMGAYLWKHRLISQPRFVAEQGHWLGRPGTAEVQVVGTPDSIQTIRVGGQAVTLVVGKIDI